MNKRGFTEEEMRTLMQRMPESIRNNNAMKNKIANYIATGNIEQIMRLSEKPHNVKVMAFLKNYMNKQKRLKGGSRKTHRKHKKTNKRYTRKH